MKHLLDTQLLLRAAGGPERHSAEAGESIENVDVELIFSAWSLMGGRDQIMAGRPFFGSTRGLRRRLLANGS